MRPRGQLATRSTGLDANEQIVDLINVSPGNRRATNFPLPRKNRPLARPTALSADQSRTRLVLNNNEAGLIASVGRGPIRSEYPPPPPPPPPSPSITPRNCEPRPPATAPLSSPPLRSSLSRSQARGMRRFLLTPLSSILRIPARDGTPMATDSISTRCVAPANS